MMPPQRHDHPRGPRNRPHFGPHRVPPHQADIEDVVSHQTHRRWGGAPSDRHRAGWHRKGRRIFLRFVTIFGLLSMLIFGGMAAFAFLLTRDTHSALLVWLMGCGLSVTFPILATGIAVYAFRNIARPLGSVMSAADSVADGDLTVRVPEARGEFGRLARSFNRMVEELAHAEEQRRNLTADVAHELRTPLHILQGSIEGLIDGVYQPTSEHLNAMLDETHLLSRLIEDLRTLSLAESGHLPLHKEPLLVADLLSDVVTSFSGPAEAVGVRLQLDASQINGATISGDAARLNQVLGNLVTNALKFTPAKGVISIRAESQPDALTLSVTDTGQGIPPEDLPYIFDRFWKGDKSRQREGGGSGLGLAIAQQLIQLHGGEINVSSIPNEGATFTITLPLS